MCGRLISVWVLFDCVVRSSFFGRWLFYFWKMKIAAKQKFTEKYAMAKNTDGRTQFAPDSRWIFLAFYVFSAEMLCQPHQKHTLTESKVVLLHEYKGTVWFAKHILCAADNKRAMWGMVMACGEWKQEHPQRNRHKYGRGLCVWRKKVRKKRKKQK